MRHLYTISTIEAQIAQPICDGLVTGRITIERVELDLLTMLAEPAPKIAFYCSFMDGWSSSDIGYDIPRCPDWLRDCFSLLLERNWWSTTTDALDLSSSDRVFKRLRSQVHRRRGLNDYAMKLFLDNLQTALEFGQATHGLTLLTRRCLFASFDDSDFHPDTPLSA